MGKLLSLLARDDSTCCSPKSYDVFLDFENAAPTETEREVYDEVDRVLKESEAVLDEIQVYKVKAASQVDKEMCNRSQQVENSRLCYCGYIHMNMICPQRGLNGSHPVTGRHLNS